MSERDEKEKQIKTGEDDEEEKFMDLGGNAGDLDGSSDGGHAELEEGDANLESFNCFNRDFVRALTLSIQDVDSNAKARKSFLDVIRSSFEHILRLSNSITSTRGAVADLSNFYVREVLKKADLIGEAIAQSQDEDEDDKDAKAVEKEVAEAQRSLQEAIFGVYAEGLALKFDMKHTTYHAGNSLINFVISLQTSSKAKARSNPSLNQQLIKLG